MPATVEHEQQRTTTARPARAGCGPRPAAVGLLVAWGAEARGPRERTVGGADTAAAPEAPDAVIIV